MLLTETMWTKLSSHPANIVRASSEIRNKKHIFIWSVTAKVYTKRDVGVSKIDQIWTVWWVLTRFTVTEGRTNNDFYGIKYPSCWQFLIRLWIDPRPLPEDLSCTSVSRAYNIGPNAWGVMCLCGINFDSKKCLKFLSFLKATKPIKICARKSLCHTCMHYLRFTVASLSNVYVRGLLWSHCKSSRKFFSVSNKILATNGIFELLKSWWNGRDAFPSSYVHKFEGRCANY